MSVLNKLGREREVEANMLMHFLEMWTDLDSGRQARRWCLDQTRGGYDGEDKPAVARSWAMPWASSF